MKPSEKGASMTKDEALKLALEALKQIDEAMPFPVAKLAQAAIKEALANVATNDTSQERVDETSESVHEPWSPVSIGVDVTKEGAHVVGIYALDKDTSQIFYAKHHPAPQRTWVGLTDEEYTELWGMKPDLLNFFRKIEAKLKEKNT